MKALQAFANCSFILGELAINLRKHPQIIRALNALEFRQYQTGSMVEGYVDVELQDGRALCWWIDIQWQETWKISSRIYLNDSEEQKTVHEFTERLTSDLDTCIYEIDIATHELVRFDALKLIGL